MCTSREVKKSETQVAGKAKQGEGAHEWQLTLGRGVTGTEGQWGP